MVEGLQHRKLHTKTQTLIKPICSSELVKHWLLVICSRPSSGNAWQNRAFSHFLSLNVLQATPSYLIRYPPLDADGSQTSMSHTPAFPVQ